MNWVKIKYKTLSHNNNNNNNNNNNKITNKSIKMGAYLHSSKR